MLRAFLCVLFFRYDFIFFPFSFEWRIAFILTLNASFNGIVQQKKRERKNTVWLTITKGKEKNKLHTKMYRRSIGRLIIRFRRSRYNKKTYAKVKDNIYTCYLNVNKICKCNDDRLLYARMQARNKRIPN